jgi:Arm DNA-binding domain
VSLTIHRLSALEVAHAKVGLHADGGGLYLQVTRTAAAQLNKSWLFRYATGGRERQMGLGSLTEVKLADARQAAAECRQQRQDGIDPIEARERARRLNEAIGVSFRRAYDVFFVLR